MHTICVTLYILLHQPRKSKRKAACRGTLQRLEWLPISGRFGTNCPKSGQRSYRARSGKSSLTDRAFLPKRGQIQSADMGRMSPLPRCAVCVFFALFPVIFTALPPLRPMPVRPFFVWRRARRASFPWGLQEDFRFPLLPRAACNLSRIVIQSRQRTTRTRPNPQRPGRTP